MTWVEIRRHYPDTWLLVEALKAHTVGSKREIDDLAVLGSYVTSVTALNDYAAYHREDPGRELYVFHTGRENLDVMERAWSGIRVDR